MPSPPLPSLRPPVQGLRQARTRPLEPLAGPIQCHLMRLPEHLPMLSARRMYQALAWVHAGLTLRAQAPVEARHHRPRGPDHSLLALQLRLLKALWDGVHLISTPFPSWPEDKLVRKSRDRILESTNENLYPAPNDLIRPGHR